MKKQDERRTYGEDRFPMGWLQISPISLASKTYKPDSRFGLHSSNLRKREREGGILYGSLVLMHPSSIQSNKLQSQRNREREIAGCLFLQRNTSRSKQYSMKLYMYLIARLSSSLSLSISLVLYSYARTCINKILSTDYETSGFMDQRFINNSSEEDSTRERPSFYRTNLQKRNKSRRRLFFFLSFFL